MHRVVCSAAGTPEEPDWEHRDVNAGERPRAAQSMLMLLTIRKPMTWQP